MKRHVSLVILGCFAMAASGARAELVDFRFSSPFASGSNGAIVIEGSFTGNLEGNMITGITNVSLFRDGNAFRGNGSLFTLQYDAKTRKWSEGGWLSLDGSNNNVMFIDTNYAKGDAAFYNYYLSVNGMGNMTFQPSFYRYREARTETMRVAVVAPAPVPEPGSWALLIGGFGLAGAALRRRHARPARAV